MKVTKHMIYTALSTAFLVCLITAFTGRQISVTAEAESVSYMPIPSECSAEIKTSPADETVQPADIRGFIEFEATAYCNPGITFSGVYVQRGMVAADPKVLPIGSVIEVSAGDYSGIYTALDTGRLIKGNIIDIFMPDYEEAVQFGRQQVKIRVIRRGWKPDHRMTANYSPSTR